MRVAWWVLAVKVITGGTSECSSSELFPWGVATEPLEVCHMPPDTERESEFGEWKIICHP